MPFELDIRRGSDGRPELHFASMFMSDWHLGTKYANAKMLYSVLSSINTGKLFLVGDILDGWYMFGCKNEFNFAAYHRETLSQLFRLQKSGKTEVTYIPGNHDETFRGKRIDGTKPYRRMVEKTVKGIKIEPTVDYTDAKGRKFYVTHGDEFDPKLYSKFGLYQAGDWCITKANDLDTWAFETLSKDFRITARTKMAFKIFEEHFMENIRNAIQKAVKDNYDGIIFGHSHLRGLKVKTVRKWLDVKDLANKIFKGQKGKEVILANSGCATDDGVEFIAFDKNGNQAVIKWMREGLKIKAEGEKEYLQTWTELGFDETIPVPERIQDDASNYVDRLVRIFYRLWPPLSRKHDLMDLAAERPLPIPLPNPKHKINPKI